MTKQCYNKAPRGFGQFHEKLLGNPYDIQKIYNYNISNAISHNIISNPEMF